MRFYYLTITLFLQGINLIAQPADAVKLNVEQVALVQDSGATGIEAVFQQTGIDINDLPLVEAFASEVILTQSTNKDYAQTASSIINVLASMASSKNVSANYVIEYASAGIAHGILKASPNGETDIYEASKTTSEASISGAIGFASANSYNLDKAVSAAASGYIAGTIEASKNNDLNIIKAVEASSAGLIFGSINSALENNSEIYQTISSTCEGIAEAAVEASIREELDLMKQITAATIGAGESAIKTATALSLEIEQTKKAIFEGLKRGTLDSIPGKGHNIRIIISPAKDVNASELLKAVQKGLTQAGLQTGYFPIIETPFENDPEVRQVSPFN